MGWLEPLGALEGREAGGRIGKGIVGIFNPEELLGPRGWVAGGEAAQGSLHLLVHPFSLTIGLRVKS